MRAPFGAYRAEGAHAQVSNCMALSAEPGRKAAYDKDLRWRIIYQRIAMGMKFAEIAKNLNIAVSTAHRTYHYFERTGNVISASTTKKRYETAPGQVPGRMSPSQLS